MSPRRPGRTQRCSRAQARRRGEHARSFLEVAELAASGHEEDRSPEYGNATATLAVLAGIAAVDAACCQVLGRRSRADDHHAAERLVAEIAPGGKDAARKLHDLIALKNDAQYGFYSVSTSELKRALRRAQALVKFAEEVLSR